MHGSEQCWRKFLGAGRFYGVGSLIMGGDLTGKAIVPITSEGDTYRAAFLGEEQRAKGDAELDELLKAIRYNGMYPWVAAAQEIAAYRQDGDARERLFDEVMLSELQRWITLADERMTQYGIDVFVMAGNDDPWASTRSSPQPSTSRPVMTRVVRVGPPRDDLARLRQPDALEQPPRDERGPAVRRVSRPRRPARGPGDAHLQPPRPALDSGLDPGT